MLADTRVVLIVGPRQAEKTTLARQFSGSDRPYITLDDAGTLGAARADPVGFIRGIEQAVIDEVQRAPELMLAIKESVDRDDAPGRFLLAGSDNVATLPAVSDSLAGRMATISLLPFAQSEIHAAPGRLLDRLFAGEEPVVDGNTEFGDELLSLVLRGAYQIRAMLDMLPPPWLLEAGGEEEAPSSRHLAPPYSKRRRMPPTFTMAVRTS